MDCIISSLTEYIDVITSITSEDTSNTLNKTEMLFRGLSSIKYELKPAIDRTPPGPWTNTLQTLEKELVESSRKKFPMVFNNDYPVLLLAKLQHYGIPTRMMDVTANALVALYFACQKSRSEDKINDDGAVYVFEGTSCSPYNPYVNAIADTYRLTNSALIGMDAYYYKVCQQDYFKPAVYKIKNEQAAVKNFSQVISKPLLVDAGDFCDRQKHQQGKFIIFPNKTHCLSGNENDEDICGDLVSVSEDIVKYKIAVSNSAKDKILEQLKRFGVSKEYLFADSIDTVCEEITREISSRFK